MNNQIEADSSSSGAMRKLMDPNNNVQNDALNHKMNDDKQEIQMPESSNVSENGDSGLRVTKKMKFRWTKSLHAKFLNVFDILGPRKAMPKKILEYMNEKDLTKKQITSHLQRHRQYLKDQAIRLQRLTTITNSDFTSPSYINQPQNSYSYNTSLCNKNSLESLLRLSLGQSSLMTNNNDSMTHNPTFGSSQSISGTFQGPTFGQNGTTGNVLGMNSNPNTGSNENSVMSDHGSSTSWLFSKLPPLKDNENQQKRNLTAQTNDVAPVVETSSIVNDHHGINEALCYTPNSRVYPDQDWNDGRFMN